VNLPEKHEAIMKQGTKEPGSEGAATAPVAAAEAPGGGGEAAASFQVLLVDDEESISTMLSHRLCREGLRCRSASNGAEALEILKQDEFDVVISDLRMPGISGMELLRTVRSAYPHITFLVATGVDDVRVGVEAMKEGAADYLLKPFQLDGVAMSVARALENKRLARQIEDYRKNLEKMVDQRTKQLRAAMKRIETTYDETLEALGAALDLRDTETAGHSRRVSLYCLEIARGMGLSRDQLRQISRGSYLHDMGKIGIPDSILLKPGKLTEEETAVMQTHARIGYDLVSRIAFLAPAAEIILTHQERYDGTGYPQGLTGEEIPIGARIFTVADTLDAMTSDRPYRRALPLSAAYEEIRREADRQFDPAVVEVFLGIPQETWERIRLEVAGLRRTGETRGSRDAA
jgi:cyclic di-GMP phosphodiesterase